MTEVARAPAPLSLGPAFSPQKRAEETTSYRPVKDKEAFRKLVPPVEFVEGSSSGAFAIPEGKFQPINDGPSSSSGSKHEVRLLSILFYSFSVPHARLYLPPRFVSPAGIPTRTIVVLPRHPEGIKVCPRKDLHTTFDEYQTLF